MCSNNFCYKLECLLNRLFLSTGYTITKYIEPDPIPESSKYHGHIFSLDHKKIIYRKDKITQDRPGAFLAVWKRHYLGEIKRPIPFEFQG